MPRSYLTTSQVASAAGVHPNTVRLYEERGFLQPVTRTPKGYRRFTEAHVDQMRLASIALIGVWTSAAIRQSALALVRRSATGDLGGALETAYQHLALVQAERAQAEVAAELLQRWADGVPVAAASSPLKIKEAAKLLGVTIDMLRNWERNGLLRVPRDPSNGYRQYGAPEIARLRVIRMLSRAGYSIMAILRMMLVLDQGQRQDLRQVLDTPRPDEDVFTASDRWLTSLAEQEQRARSMIYLLEEMIGKQSA